ncbi:MULTISPECIES: hypothetical protein [unclassified Curtobacterium]|uniref:hypothetical protein n=1 Tax=unclassified Curtobacterium TaxID=257496 RepID=UPI000DA8BD95|nr:MULTISPECIES: hypothetical protein [unclassified Curtobacterium]PZE27126.1 hypothetical protein DEI86_06320 [Curtobacterium sp. MCBD17_028]PZE74761.1 hypothetical protein DEI82_10090 [Curtobacterium sp. MCBD17_019]
MPGQTADDGRSTPAARMDSSAHIDSSLAIHDGRFCGPPVDHRRAIARSVLWFLGAAGTVLLVCLLVEHHRLRRSFALARRAVPAS